MFSGPQLSLFEMKNLAELFDGRKVQPGTQVSSRPPMACSQRGAQARLCCRRSRPPASTMLEGVCFYILQNLSQMRAQNGWTNMISNSAKIVNIIGAHKFNTILRRTHDCVDIACTGGSDERRTGNHPGRARVRSGSRGRGGRVAKKASARATTSIAGPA